MRKWLILGLLFLLLVLAVTCVPGGGGDGGDLTYRGPLEMGIGKDEFLPGTEIRYLGKAEDGALVSIAGQQALKKTGDSLNWVYNPVEDVAVDLNLRVILVTEDKLHALGTAKIVVVDPTLQPAAVDESAPIRYKLPVDYRVKKGQAIPGTTITYLGKTDQGAHLGNIEGYAYRELGDSIVWKGQLRPGGDGGVWLDLDLRTLVIGEDSLNVAGTAELWIAP